MLEYEAERVVPSAPLTRKERGKDHSLVVLPGEWPPTYRKQHLVLFGETILYVEQLESCAGYGKVGRNRIWRVVQRRGPAGADETPSPLAGGSVLRIPMIVLKIPLRVR